MCNKKYLSDLNQNIYLVCTLKNRLNETQNICKING